MEPLKPVKQKNNNRLGRGLDFLLGPVDAKNEILLLDIEKIQANKEQPRKNFDEEALWDLSRSIKKNGVLQAILVEKQGENYQIIAGERRWRAACLAGLKKIPALLKSSPAKQDVRLWALIENLQREDLNPIEQAEAFKKIMLESGLSQELLAENLAISRSSLANTLRLLNLDESVQKLVRKGKLSFSQARELLKFKDTKKQRDMAELCLKRSLTVQKLKHIQKKSVPPFWLKQAISQLERKLSKRIQLKYFKGKGSFHLSFKNETELKKLLTQLLESS